MNEELNQQRILENDINYNVDITEATRHLRAALPSIAKQLIESYQDQSEPNNVRFASSPDNYLQHAPNWHQHGIITHSYEFEKAMKESVPQYLKDWALDQAVDEVLSERIDSVTKRQLLEVASLLHDIGKFTARTTDYNNDRNDASAHFENHEEHSGKIIRNNLRQTLLDLHLTNSQIDYIASCAELHFELGKVRRAAKKSGGFTMKFADTPAFKKAAQEIINTNPNFKLEIGLLFIADNLSKSDVRSTGNNDTAIEKERNALSLELKSRGLNPMLINQVLQMPVNFKIAHNYLEQWEASR